MERVLSCSSSHDVLITISLASQRRPLPALLHARLAIYKKNEHSELDEEGKDGGGGGRDE